MRTREEYLAIYHEYAKANCWCIGIKLHRKLYMLTSTTSDKTILDKYVKLVKDSNGNDILRFLPSCGEKHEILLDSNWKVEATWEGKAWEENAKKWKLRAGYNRGNVFEMSAFIRFTCQSGYCWKPSVDSFYEGWDVADDWGRKFEVKLETGTLCKVSTLEGLVK